MILIKTYKMPLYSGVFKIAFFDDNSEFEQYILKNFKLKHDIRYNAGFTAHGGYRGRMAYMVAFNVNHLNHGTIAHEAFHLTNMVLHNSGVELDTTNDEAQAYFLGWIVNHVYKLINKYGFKPGHKLF